MEKISIIVPVYGVYDYIDKCVLSLVSQTYKNIEIILIDDGSPDRSGEKCDLWAQKDERVLVIHKENGGVSSARNEGLKIATGKYIGFADPDDYIEPDMYEKLMGAILREDADIVYSTFFIDTENYSVKKNLAFKTGIYEFGELLNPVFFGTKNSNKQIMTTSLCVSLLKADIIKEYNIVFDTELSYAEDAAFYAEYLSKCGRIYVLNEAFYHYVMRKSSVTHNVFSKLTEDNIKKEKIYWEKLDKIFKKNNISEDIYSENLKRRPIVFFKDRVFMAWSFNNKMSLKEKHAYLKHIINEMELKKLVKNINLKGMRLSDRASAFAVKANCLLIADICAVITKAKDKTKALLGRMLNGR